VDGRGGGEAGLVYWFRLPANEIGSPGHKAKQRPAQHHVMVVLVRHKAVCV